MLFKEGFGIHLFGPLFASAVIPNSSIGRYQKDFLSTSQTQFWNVTPQSPLWKKSIMLPRRGWKKSFIGSKQGASEKGQICKKPFKKVFEVFPTKIRFLFWHGCISISEPFVGKVPHVFALMVCLNHHLSILWIITLICSLLVASFELSKYLKDGPCQLFQTNGCFVLAMFNIMAILWLQGVNLNAMMGFGIRRFFWIPIIALLLSLCYVSFCDYHILSYM